MTAAAPVKNTKSAGRKAAADPPGLDAKKKDAIYENIRAAADAGCFIVLYDSKKKALNTDGITLKNPPPQDDAEITRIQKEAVRLIEAKAGGYGLLPRRGVPIMMLDKEAGLDMPVGMNRLMTHSRPKYIGEKHDIPDHSYHGFVIISDMQPGAATAKWASDMCDAYHKELGEKSEVFAAGHPMIQRGWFEAGGTEDDGSPFKTAWSKLSDGKDLQPGGFLQMRRAEFEDLMRQVHRLDGRDMSDLLKEAMDDDGLGNENDGDPRVLAGSYGSELQRIIEGTSPKIKDGDGAANNTMFKLAGRVISNYFRGLPGGMPAAKYEKHAEDKRAVAAVDAAFAAMAVNIFENPGRYAAGGKNRDEYEAARRWLLRRGMFFWKRASSSLHVYLCDEYAPIPLHGMPGKPLIWSGANYDGLHNDRPAEGVIRAEIRRRLKQSGEDAAKGNAVGEIYAQFHESRPPASMAEVMSIPGCAFQNGWMPDDAPPPVSETDMLPNNPANRNLTVMPHAIGFLPADLAKQAVDPTAPEFTLDEYDRMFGGTLWYETLKHNFWLDDKSPDGRADFGGFVNVLEAMACTLGGAGTHVGRKFAWVGKTGCGKSVHIAMLQGMHGTGNICSVSMQEMGTPDSFEVINLEGKHVNLIEDAETHTVKDVGKFKAIVMGQLTKGRHMYAESHFFYPTCAHIEAANKLPVLKFDDAVLDRHHITVWKRQYEKNAPTTDTELDIKVKNRRSDYPRILAGLWAVRCRLRLRGGVVGESGELVGGWKLANPQTTDDVRRKYEEHMATEDPLVRLLESEVVECDYKGTELTAIRKKDLMERLPGFCEEHNLTLPPLSDAYVGRLIKKMFPNAKMRQTLKGARDWITGICWLKDAGLCVAGVSS